MAENQQDNGKKSPAPAGVPQYVLDYAPLLHLSKKDTYHPSSITAQLLHTRPQISLKDIEVPSNLNPISLSNLDELNKLGTKAGSDIYLTSTVDITTNPEWLEGVKPDDQGGTGDEKTAVVIVVDKGDGVVDAFYMYFFAFNWGGVVLKNQLGDHVGDWEHNMIRFVKGAPKYVWYSQHANGEAFKYEVLKKDGSGKRPLAYCANGSHALFPTPGLHDHTIPNLSLPFALLLVDETDAGPIYDPLLSAYYYQYHPSPSSSPASPKTDQKGGTFTAYDSSTPVNYFYFRGRWGDEQYPDTDKRQQQLVGNRKYVGGPTGPADKQLNRKNVWPENTSSKGQKIRSSLGIGSWGDKIKKWFSGLFRGKKVQKVLVTGETVK
ncbi:hypothetical protein K469DRAFT_544849 [Zopfia rhizophila CBS 207.26]|uniref:Vacuolar protein sorting-associated protein 62 n=1 Tax=Zopfia rhizophila CBS 207.26 TaxID=1314779 RepID=A0A6A6EX77_9PEZI|nr:hypothetical protein K469DRAFT_544849 [Zopfia rhizophila CBS 207.26]